MNEQSNEQASEEVLSSKQTSAQDADQNDEQIPRWDWLKDCCQATKILKTGLNRRMNNGLTKATKLIRTTTQ